MELFAGNLPPIHLLWIAVAYLGTGRAIAGNTKWGRHVDVGGGIAVGDLSRDVSAWIPAFAGMTNWGAGTTSAGAASFRRTRKPFERIFVPIAHPGWRRHTKV